MSIPFNLFDAGPCIYLTSWSLLSVCTLFALCAISLNIPPWTINVELVKLCIFCLYLAFNDCRRFSLVVICLILWLLPSLKLLRLHFYNTFKSNDLIVIGSISVVYLAVWSTNVQMFSCCTLGFSRPCNDSQLLCSGLDTPHDSFLLLLRWFAYS